MNFLELFERPVQITKDGMYIPNGEERHRLDVYRPPNADDLPVAIWFYGGGWRSGDKRLFEHLGRAMAVRGIVTVAVNYRLTPDVTFPAHAEDCAAAVAWTYANIEAYGGDRTKIFLTGHSAGAHLASILTLDRTYLDSMEVPREVIRGVVAISGASDLVNHVDSTVFTKREEIEEAFGVTEDELRKASPLYHVSEGVPPYLLIVAEKDPEGLQDQSRLLADAIREVEGEAMFISVKGRDHFSIVRRFGPSNDTTAEAMGEFIRRIAQRK